LHRDPRFAQVANDAAVGVIQIDVGEVMNLLAEMTPLFAPHCHHRGSVGGYGLFRPEFHAAILAL